MGVIYAFLYICQQHRAYVVCARRPARLSFWSYISNALCLFLIYWYLCYKVFTWFWNWQAYTRGCKVEARSIKSNSWSGSVEESERDGSPKEQERRLWFLGAGIRYLQLSHVWSAIDITSTTQESLGKLHISWCSACPFALRQGRGAYLSHQWKVRSTWNGPLNACSPIS